MDASRVLSIYGTPAWANHDKGQNVAPINAIDLRKFAYAAALRYSGKFVSNGEKLPAVRDWLAWNEPNNPVFLTPQYRRVGNHWVMASAISYAKICNAIYRGVHSTGYSNEKVACGVTAPRGNNNPTSSRPSVSPLAFLRAVKRDGPCSPSTPGRTIRTTRTRRSRRRRPTGPANRSSSGTSTR